MLLHEINTVSYTDLACADAPFRHSRPIYDHLSHPHATLDVPLGHQLNILKVQEAQVTSATPFLCTSSHQGRQIFLGGFLMTIPPLIWMYYRHSGLRIPGGEFE